MLTVRIRFTLLWTHLVLQDLRKCTRAWVCVCGGVSVHILLWTQIQYHSALDVSAGSTWARNTADRETLWVCVRKLLLQKMVKSGGRWQKEAISVHLNHWATCTCARFHTLMESQSRCQCWWWFVMKQRLPGRNRSASLWASRVRKAGLSGLLVCHTSMHIHLTKHPCSHKAKL